MPDSVSHVNPVILSAINAVLGHDYRIYMIYRILLCALLWQLLASEHSCVLKKESLLRLHHISPIVSTQ